MTSRVERAGLCIDEALAEFIEHDVLGPLGHDMAAFWPGFAALLVRLVPENRALLAKRDALQAQIDAWHEARVLRQAQDERFADEYQAFLHEIGYLVPEPAAFAITTQNVDPEIATMAGPQLVVPVLNARFLLNAANARWGSLYDALYGTDVLDAPPAKPGGYDAARGSAVVAYVRAFLDATIPDWEAALASGQAPHLFQHNGLHIEIIVDRNSPVGATDPLGIADVILESALTTIVDLEDSIRLPWKIILPLHETKMRGLGYICYE